MKKTMGCLLLVLMVSSVTSFAEGARHDVRVNNPTEIVGKLVKIGQTEQISDTVVFTSKSTGLFRATVLFMITTNNTGNGYWQTRLAWKDIKNRARTVFNAPSFKEGTHQSTLIFAAQGGVPVQLSVVPFGNVTGSVYDVFVVVERLTKIPSF